jgi:hypothetical protein
MEVMSVKAAGSDATNSATGSDLEAWPRPNPTRRQRGANIKSDIHSSQLRYAIQIYCKHFLFQTVHLILRFDCVGHMAASGFG